MKRDTTIEAIKNAVESGAMQYCASRFAGSCSPLPAGFSIEATGDRADQAVLTMGGTFNNKVVILVQNPPIVGNNNYVLTELTDQDSQILPEFLANPFVLKYELNNTPAKQVTALFTSNPARVEFMPEIMINGDTIASYSFGSLVESFKINGVEKIIALREEEQIMFDMSQPFVVEINFIDGVTIDRVDYGIGSGQDPVTTAASYIGNTNPFELKRWETEPQYQLLRDKMIDISIKTPTLGNLKGFFVMDNNGEEISALDNLITENGFIEYIFSYPETGRIYPYANQLMKILPVVKPGYIFKGWAIDDPGNIVYETLDITIDINNDVTDGLFLIFEEDQ